MYKSVFQESSLLSAVCSNNLHCAVLAIDVWCFMARWASYNITKDIDSQFTTVHGS